MRVVNLHTGASTLLTSNDDVTPLLLSNVAFILPGSSSANANSVSRVTDMLVLTAVGGWLGGADGESVMRWSLLR